MLVEPLLSLLSMLPTGKNLIMNSGILSALWVLSWKLQRLSQYRHHQSRGPKTHSLNLPGCIVGLKSPCAAGANTLVCLFLPAPCLWDSLYSSPKGHTQYSTQLFHCKRQIFIINCGIPFLCLPFGLWKAHSTSVLQLLVLVFMELQSFANRKPGLSESEKFGHGLLQSDAPARKYSRLWKVTPLHYWLKWATYL